MDRPPLCRSAAGAPRRTSSAPPRPIAASRRSDGLLWQSRARPLRSPPENAARLRENAMNTRKQTNNPKSEAVRRRDVLRGLGVGAGAAVAASSTMVEPAAAQANNDEKRKARYQPNSADVQNYYRVNRYPK